jgi:O-antigen/teichoic acid export membrane protein
MPQRTIGAVIAVLVGNAAASFAYLTESLKLTLRKLTTSLKLFRESVLYGVKGQAGNIVQFFNYRLDFFLVNYFLNISQLGIYAISVGLAELVWRVPNSAAVVLFPRIASRNSLETAHFTMTVCRRTFLIMLGFAGLIIIAGKPVISTLFGSKFSGAYIPLLLLIPGIVVLGISNVLAIDLAGRGRPEIRTYGAAIAGIATLVLDLLLIPKIGIRGAALASSVSYTIATGVVIYFFSKITKSSLKHIAVPTWGDFEYFLGLVGDTARKFLSV